MSGVAEPQRLAALARLEEAEVLLREALLAGDASGAVFNALVRIERARRALS